MKSQKDLTDRAFERRLDEVKNAKELLEKQLAETIVKIGEVEESTKSVERAIAAKQVYNFIVHTYTPCIIILMPMCLTYSFNIIHTYWVFFNQN